MYSLGTSICLSLIIIINCNIGPSRTFDVSEVVLILSKINALQTRDDVLHPARACYKAEPEKKRTI